MVDTKDTINVPDENTTVSSAYYSNDDVIPANVDSVSNSSTPGKHPGTPKIYTYPSNDVHYVPMDDNDFHPTSNQVVEVYYVPDPIIDSTNEAVS